LRYNFLAFKFKIYLWLNIGDCLLAFAVIKPNIMQQKVTIVEEIHEFMPRLSSMVDR
jgi:hypothetical protein